MGHDIANVHFICSVWSITQSVCRFFSFRFWNLWGKRLEILCWNRWVIQIKFKYSVVKTKIWGLLIFFFIELWTGSYRRKYMMSCPPMEFFMKLKHLAFICRKRNEKNRQSDWVIDQNVREDEIFLIQYGGNGGPCPARGFTEILYSLYYCFGATPTRSRDPDGRQGLCWWFYINFYIHM